jgi:hypothetical protein
VRARPRLQPAHRAHEQRQHAASALRARPTLALFPAPPPPPPRHSAGLAAALLSGVAQRPLRRAPC